MCIRDSCYTNDMNGDGINNDLMYIPKDDSEINFKTEEEVLAKKQEILEFFLISEEMCIRDSPSYCTVMYISGSFVRESVMTPFIWADALMAVSYTHLDVYKRQW